MIGLLMTDNLPSYIPKGDKRVPLAAHGGRPFLDNSKAIPVSEPSPQYAEGILGDLTVESLLGESPAPANREDTASSLLLSESSYEGTPSLDALLKESDKGTAVLRSDLWFGWLEAGISKVSKSWYTDVQLASPIDPGSVDRLSPDEYIQSKINQVAPQSWAYWKDAIRYFFSTYPETYINLFDWRDYSVPATVADVALHAWTLEGSQFTKEYFRPLSVALREGLRVVTVADTSRPSVSDSMVDLRLSQYSSLPWSQWLNSMFSGSKGIPFPLALALAKFIVDYDLPQTKNTFVSLIKREIDVSPANPFK